MKKIFANLLLFLFLFAQTAVFGATTDWTDTQSVQRVNNIGKKLLSGNNLSTQISFKVVDSEEVNAFATGDNELCVYTGLLKSVTDDSELAGVIAHEIGHILNSHVAKQSLIDYVSGTVINVANVNDKIKLGALAAKNLSMKKLSRTEETEADITGVDLMVKAGYNPLAMVSVLYKITGNYVDILSDHPSGDKRTMYVYDYILYTYPSAVKSSYSSDSYTQFLSYASPIVEKRNKSTYLTNKFNSKQAKLQAKRVAKLTKYQNSSNGLGWDASYLLIKSLSNN